MYSRSYPRFYSKNPGTVAHVLGFSYISGENEVIRRMSYIDELARLDVCSILDEIGDTGKYLKIYCYIEKIKPSLGTSKTSSTPVKTDSNGGTSLTPIETDSNQLSVR